MGTHLNCLAEAILMSTHNIYLTKFPKLPVILSWIIPNQQNADLYHLNHGKINAFLIHFSSLNDLRDFMRAHLLFV